VSQAGCHRPQVTQVLDNIIHHLNDWTVKSMLVFELHSEKVPQITAVRLP
jgi:hypothetical protein